MQIERESEIEKNSERERENKKENEKKCIQKERSVMKIGRKKSERHIVRVHIQCQRVSNFEFVFRPNNRFKAHNYYVSDFGAHSTHTA